ncbi:unnamed protein product [Paramecium primaurelia]|uniref:Uncharacterized protein n=1 Tax=Paramecium primaurelia TaxID=5886 RepID=A0A8S1JQM1_PARPR|nr:unnamed protein product [Paramecium primaurelia]
MADTFLLTEAQITQKKPVQLSPPKVETEAEKKERHWQQILNKILFNPPNDDYYQKWPIKPGIFFYKALALGKLPTEQIRVNIPESIMCFEQTYILMYTDPITGQLMRKTDIGYQDFENKVHQYHEEYLKRHVKDDRFEKRTNVFENQDSPYIISRGQTGQDWNMSKAVYTFRQQKERKVQLDNNKLEQRFVISRVMKATIVRLVFYTKNSKSSHANYGYRIMNVMELYDPNPKKSITNKTTINTEQQNSFTIQQIKGVGLYEYEKVCDQIVSYLEKNYPVRIKTGVFDFLQDPEGRIWLFNCKQLIMENAISMSEIQGVGQGKKTLDQLTCSVYCKLCGIIFKKDDASKTLTYKLLWELVQHLKKRNKQLTNIKVSHLSTRPCRVCDVCYMLIVGEHELVEIEQKFAIAQNIPLGDAIIRVPMDSKPKHRPALLNEQLYQWRLLFYLEMVDLQGKRLIDLNGNPVGDLKNIVLQYRLHQSKSSFKTHIIKDDNYQTLKSNKQQTSQSQQKQLRFSGIERSDSIDAPEGQIDDQFAQINDENLKLNVIRVHYFFSETTDIEKFLSETEIKMRLCQGSEWVNYVAEGSTKTIHHFKNSQMGGQRHRAQVLLFFANGHYCILNLQVGLFCDGQYNTGKLNLYKYNNVYFPDDNYYNCNPFPPEWMEIFDPQYVNMHNTFEEQVKEIEAYSPKCTKHELNQMIDFNKYKETTKYKAVKPKIDAKKRDIQSAAPQYGSNTQQVLPKLPQSAKKYSNTMRQFDEQQLLQHYTLEEQDIGEILFEEKKQNKKISKEDREFYEQHNLYDEEAEDSQEDQELNLRLNKQIQKSMKQLDNQSQQSNSVRPIRSAQQLPPKGHR